jgi:hypothetical protein
VQDTAGTEQRKLLAQFRGVERSLQDRKEDGQALSLKGEQNKARKQSQRREETWAMIWGGVTGVEGKMGGETEFL